MLRIQDNCRSAYQRVHADQDIEQGREVEEQQREGNIGGEIKLIATFQARNGYLSQVTAGVREYFNVMLSSQLLYRQERHQYEQLVKQVGMSCIVHSYLSPTVSTIDKDDPLLRNQGWSHVASMVPFTFSGCLQSLGRCWHTLH